MGGSLAGPPGVHMLGGSIFIDRDCVIEPGALLRGPPIIGSEIRTGPTCAWPSSAATASSVPTASLKTAILLDGAWAPHQNYVGDSILGRNTNLGAGTILPNVKNIGKESFVPGRRATRSTPASRVSGAILGDGCRTGCNSVLNPGC